MNNVCLIGRLTRDPELRTTASGISNCKFSLAVDGRPNADGEPHTDFINIVVWRNLADNVAKYCKKGSMIGVVGRIQTGSYQDQDGSTKYTTDVVAENVRFLTSKKEESSNSSSSVDSFESEEMVLTDDDLPF
jgi:single-strand DNA-binding protein